MSLFIKCFALLALITFLAQWLYQHWYKPRVIIKKLKIWLEKPHIARAQRVLGDCIRGQNATRIAKRERRRLGMDTTAFVYGEINFLSLMAIMEAINLQDGEVFCDLGSGSGNAVLSVALAYPTVHAMGIELLPALYELACGNLQCCQQSEPSLSAEFIQGDFLTVDISQVTVLFINATGFFGELWEGIVRQCESLPVGARIVMTSKTLSGPQFKCVNDQPRLMSWGECSTRIYLKTA